eukprot:9691352-Lingulodinium_polyedra.AAC.1
MDSRLSGRQGGAYFILPNDRVVQLEVVKDVPYLQPGKPFCRPRARRGRRCFACGAKSNPANPAKDAGGEGPSSAKAGGAGDPGARAGGD